MPTPSMTSPEYTIRLEPIGVVRSPFHERVDAPRQPSEAAEVKGTVELFAGRGLEDAVQDLDQWDHIWLIVWFDRNEGNFRPKVQPPRSDVKRGVFATRAPYRPNPIGLSAVRLLSVEGLTLHIQGLDLLEGTPVLDVKPYVAYTDAIVDASRGWLDTPADRGPLYTLAYEPRAAEQLDYLRDTYAVDLRPRIEAALSMGPKPHAYRRIRERGEVSELGVKDWRIVFRTDGTVIRVLSLVSGYKPKELSLGKAPDDHLAFCARFGG